MELVIQPFESLPNRQHIEIVERKGLGHPDTLCDAIAERICVQLCRWFLDRFDTVRRSAEATCSSRWRSTLVAALPRNGAA